MMQQTIEGAERNAGAQRPAEPDARHWAMALAPYREPGLARSLVELLVTVVPFVALWLLMLLGLRYPIGSVCCSRCRPRAFSCACS